MMVSTLLLSADPLEGGQILLVAMLGLLLGTPTVSMYVYGLFFLSRRLGELAPSRSRVRGHFLMTLLLSAGLSLGAWHLPVDPYLKFFLSVTMILIHSVPMSLGYWAGKENLERERKRALEANTMRLLMEWEREHLEAANEYQE
ncbi:MAG TPA: hypothetical protein PKY51_09390 [Fimbriimonadaceae bacterium]|nr:hypothetical protein [Fimbriimonadaceae bacterium]